jgi:hypothetical protein
MSLEPSYQRVSLYNTFTARTPQAVFDSRDRGEIHSFNSYWLQ